MSQKFETDGTIMNQLWDVAVYKNSENETWSVFIHACVAFQNTKFYVFFVAEICLLRLIFSQLLIYLFKISQFYNLFNVVNIILPVSLPI